MAAPVNGIYVLQGIVPSQIAAAPVGVKVVDLYDDDDDLFSSSQVAQMESGGGEVLGYFSIGEAEDFRSYWSSLPSSVLGPEDPQWPGDYQVAYWTPTWLTVSENYIQTMINQGYDGAYFDVVDEAEQSWAIAHVPGHTLAAAEGAMVTLIQEVAKYARAQDPDFQIWINSSGAEDMLANKTLVSTINGAYEEQLYYQNATQPESPAYVSSNVQLLDNLTAAGKPVIAIEYVSGASEVASVETQAAADGFGYYIANPNFSLDGVDTEGFTLATVARYLAARAYYDQIPGGFAIADTAANVARALDALNADSHLKSITLTDGGTPTLTVTAAQTADDTVALRKIISPYAIAVSDSASHIVAKLSALNSNKHVASLTATSGEATLSGGVGVKAPRFSETGAGTTLTLAENLSYGGDFTEGAGSVLSIDKGDTLTFTGRSTLSGTVTGAGTLALSGDAATLEVDAGVAAGLTISFTGAHSVLDLGDPQAFAGKISGFDTAGTNDTLEIAAPWTYVGFAENGAHTQGTLTFSHGTTDISIVLIGDYHSANFVHLAGSNSSTLVTYV